VSGVSTRAPAHPAVPGAEVVATQELVARWRPGDFLLVRGEGGLLGAGAARRLEVPPGEGQVAAAARLAESVLAELADGACVAGALPFRGDQPALLTVPQRILRATPGGRAGGSTPGPGEGEADPHPAAGPTPPPVAEGPDLAESLGWRAEPSREVFAAAVAEAVRHLRAGELEKVVLARILEAENPGLDPRLLLAALRRRNPDAHVYAAHAGAGSVFLGAMPETVIRRRGEAVLSIPHAGTMPRSPDSAADREAAATLLASPKERHEHRVVAEAVAAALAPHCATLEVEPAPHLVATQRVWHLATTVRGRLRPSAPGALGLAAALHPTPAVCGHPAAAALQLIDRLEPGGRGLYAGLVGWMDGRGDGAWALSLRCALVTPERIRLHAGGGLVAESDPAAEVAETTAKFGTLLDALSEALGPGRGGPPRG
jgi:isochorismate synthase